ncbi:dTDP-4-dehydrorhamnose 3,5-epimerase-like enzyme [Pedobacter sp. CG_S7]|uniref:hypothetical protein n=1 Tax=Pedobacter sp. CG_S7 TaxID=3143930 RepID=UPI0033912CEA
MLKQPEFIIGGNHCDKRGQLSFVNDFSLQQVKRFYHIHHPDINVIRAWQGHQIEQKWFYVLEGSFDIVLVKPDDWTQPSKDLEVIHYRITALSGVLHVPSGYANGFKAVLPNSKMIVFSDATVEQSNNDNYRFDQNMWFDWNII